MLMTKNKIYPFFIFLFLISIIPTFLLGNTKKSFFYEDDLSRESVIPVFNSKKVVRSRSIRLKNRLETTFAISRNLSEVFFEAIQYSGGIIYYINEEFGLSVSFFKNLSGLSPDAKAIFEESKNVDFNNAPEPLDTTLLNLQWNLYYGKMSLSKSTVLNTHLYTLSGLSLHRIRGDSLLGIDLGIGQKFYFSKSISLRTDLSMIVFSGPDILSNNLKEYREASDFKKKLHFHFLLSLGLSFLI